MDYKYLYETNDIANKTIFKESDEAVALFDLLEPSLKDLDSLYSRDEVSDWGSISFSLNKSNVKLSDTGDSVGYQIFVSPEDNSAVINFYGPEGRYYYPIKTDFKNASKAAKVIVNAHKNILKMYKKIKNSNDLSAVTKKLKMGFDDNV